MSKSSATTLLLTFLFLQLVATTISGDPPPRKTLSKVSSGRVGYEGKSSLEPKKHPRRMAAEGLENKDPQTKELYTEPKKPSKNGIDPTLLGSRLVKPHVVKNVAETQKLKPHVLRKGAETRELKPHILKNVAETLKPKPKPVPESPAVLFHKLKAPSGPPTVHNGRPLQQESQPAEDQAEEAPDVPAGFQSETQKPKPVPESPALLLHKLKAPAGRPTVHNGRRLQQESPSAGDLEDLAELSPDVPAGFQSSAGAQPPAGAQLQTGAQSPAGAQSQAGAQSPAAAQMSAEILQVPAGAHPPGDKPTEDQQWCVAKPDATNDVLNYNIDYCCRMGVDCRPIQPGGACYDNNNLKSRASYVMNEYFNNNGHRSFNCFFSKSGIITPIDPSYGKCIHH